MSKNTPVSEVEKNDIVIAYESGMTIRETAKVAERSPTTVAEILDSKGVYHIARQGPRSPRQNKKKQVTCPHCKAAGHLKGAKFCYKCGHDIRTQSDILRERLGKLTADLPFLPESVRDNFYAVIQDTIDYLRKV